MRLLKLVRDRVPVEFPNLNVVYKPIDDRDEMIGALRAKLVEEVIEYLQNPCVEELADIQEITQALCTLDLQIHDVDLNRVMYEKRRMRGGFASGIGMYVEEVKNAA